MQGKYPVITLCGSTRFKDQFMEAQKRLTLEGNFEGIGHCALGYAAEPAKDAAPRKENYVYYVE